MDLSRLSQSLQASLETNATLDDSSGGAPVDKWHPEYCGEIPLAIRADGTWLYQNTPFTRRKLVNLFASVLKRENDDYFLVTPAEKVKIQVDDVPFVIVDWEDKDGTIWLKTQTDNHFPLNAEHPAELRPLPNQSDTEIPYVLVRSNLFARLHQNVYYQMLDKAELITSDGLSNAVIKSAGQQISLGKFCTSD